MVGKKDVLKLLVIDCVNYVYVKRENQYCFYLSDYLFDGEEPERTYKIEYYKLKKIPSIITKKKSEIRKNERYELKAGYAATDLMPQVITKEAYGTGEYDDIIALYNYRYDKEDGGYEEVEFEVTVIYKREDFEFARKKYPSEVDLITQIEYPEELYQEKPNKISSPELLKIIRSYVRRNIDNNVAKITSDYDFHFEVRKKIALDSPYTYSYDENLFNKRKKPKWVSKMIASKEQTIINFKDKSSSSDYGDDCVVCPSITGENYEDLCRKINQYLEELIKTINKKYCECPHCKGWGVVDVKE